MYEYAYSVRQISIPVPGIRYVFMYVNLLLCVHTLVVTAAAAARHCTSPTRDVLIIAVYRFNKYSDDIVGASPRASLAFYRRNFEPFSRHFAIASEAFFIQQYLTSMFFKSTARASLYTPWQHGCFCAAMPQMGASPPRRSPTCTYNIIQGTRYSILMGSSDPVVFLRFSPAAESLLMRFLRRGAPPPRPQRPALWMRSRGAARTWARPRRRDIRRLCPQSTGLSRHLSDLT